VNTQGKKYLLRGEKTATLWRTQGIKEAYYNSYSIVKGEGEKIGFSKNKFF